MNKTTSFGITFLLSHIYKKLSHYLPFLPSHFDLHLKELLKGSSIAFIIRMLGMVTGYLFALLVTRNYGAEAMGIFALSQTVLLVISLFSKLGLDTASMRFISEYSSQGKWNSVKEVYIKSLKMVIPVSLFLSCLFFYFSPFISDYFFKKPHLSSYFQIISLSILPLVILSIHSESLRGLKKIIAYAFFRNMSVSLSGAVVIGIAIFLSKDARVPVIAHVIGIIILTIVSLIVWLKHTNIFKYTIENSISYNTILNVSLPLMLSSSMLFILQWTDTIMLGILKTEAEVGIYNVALKIANFTSISLFAINSIAAPKFAEFYGKRDMKGLGKVARQSTKLIFWSSFPVLLIFLFFPSMVLGVFGTEFKSGVYALILLTIGQFVNAISGSVGLILQMTGKQKAFQNIIVIATILNIGLNAFLIPKYGINGAAFATAISITFWNLSSVMYVKLYLNITTLYIPMISKKKD
ncbi:MAG: Polysaccharide biosynthesis protein [Candidatus Jettenia ecosi]|uniref:Polysaccharide biosynthesis protein n=1 Tax=Candidatus Jettenia ecosi TaxID=2494326 RepID=A0A533QD57_9BACT|nr:MAG: Polysaccharide biosynthesis protein [Candidatus Jettenia ecosi]